MNIKYKSNDDETNMFAAWGLGGLVFLLSLILPISWIASADLRELSILLMIQFVIVFMLSNNQRHNGNMIGSLNPVSIAVAGFILAIFASACFSSQPAESLYASFHWLVLVFFIAALSHTVIHFSNVEYYLSTLLIIGFHCYLLLLIIGFYLFEIDINMWAFPVLDYVRAFGIIMGLGAVVSLIRSVEDNISQTKSIVFFASAVILMSALFWSGTRTALVAFFGALCVVALINRNLFNVKNIATLLFCIISALWLAVALDPGVSGFGVERLFFKTIDEGMDSSRVGSGRIPLWGDYLLYLKENLYFGVGEYSHHYIHDEARVFRDHPENIFLYFMANWGIAGGAAAIFLVAWVLKCSIHNYKNNEGRELITLIVILYVLIASLIEAGFYRHIDRVIFALFSALAIARSNILTGVGIVGHRTMTSMVVPLMVVFATFMILLGMYEERIAFMDRSLTVPESKLVSMYSIHMRKWNIHNYYVDNYLDNLSDSPVQYKDMLVKISNTCSAKSCRDYAKAIIAKHDERWNDLFYHYMESLKSNNDHYSNVYLKKICNQLLLSNDTEFLLQKYGDKLNKFGCQIGF